MAGNNKLKLKSWGRKLREELAKAENDISGNFNRRIV
jgi:hypothetical protein